MAIGLAVSSSYNSQSSANLAVEGILDAISAGILLYTGLVEVSWIPYSGHTRDALTRLFLNIAAAGP